MASPTQWIWVWVVSWSWTGSQLPVQQEGTGNPGMLQSMGSQRVRHNWVTELNWYGNKDSFLKTTLLKCFTSLLLWLWPLNYFAVMVQLLRHIQLFLKLHGLSHSSPMDLLGPSVHGILQVRILEWLPLFFPGDLSNLGMEPEPPALKADSLPLSHYMGTQLSQREVKITEQSLDHLSLLCALPRPTKCRQGT